MATILYSSDLQPEWRGMNNEYGGFLGYGEDLDAPERIPCGGWIKYDGVPMQNSISREYGYQIKADRDETPEMVPMPKKRGRPAKADAASNAARQAKHRAKAKAAGLCPCCGQHYPNAPK